eukprot:1158588-Pelagomonas_calceolata.AAC.3
MPKTKKGYSAGEYKNSLEHGVSNQFQASWLEEHERHLWLEEHGKDVDGVLRQGASGVGLCSIATLVHQIHEKGQKHCAKEQQQQQQTAAARSSLQQQLDAMQRRAEQEMCVLEGL